MMEVYEIVILCLLSQGMEYEQCTSRYFRIIWLFQELKSVMCRDMLKWVNCFDYIVQFTPNFGYNRIRITGIWDKDEQSISINMTYQTMQKLHSNMFYTQWYSIFPNHSILVQPYYLCKKTFLKSVSRSLQNAWESGSLPDLLMQAVP